MGTIYPFSGLDTVIRGFDSILARHANAKLLIVGSGEDENRLRQLAKSHHVGDHVIFTGMQPYAILPDVIRSSDVCINPFQLNGVTRNILPTKLFQYMACAKPVLATSLPGTRTFLSGEEHGVVYAELPDFNNQLVELLSDANRCEILGKRGHEAALNYDWQRIAETMSTWLEEASRG
jgi:glycosyltransferase involved in cell wall biosynthesis